MVCVNGRRVDCWGAWIWPSVLILPFFAKGSMLLDCAEVCSVAVLLTVCTVFVWKRLCVCSGWGTERELALYSWFLLHSAACSVVIFPLLAEDFLVSCFKIASREKGSIAYRDSWSQVADKPSLAMFFQLFPALGMALLELWVPWMCLSVYPVLMSSIVYTVAYTLQSQLALFFQLELSWIAKPLVTDCLFSLKNHISWHFCQSKVMYMGEP